jgi:hypothetical protein
MGCEQNQTKFVRSEIFLEKRIDPVGRKVHAPLGMERGFKEAEY